MDSLYSALVIDADQPMAGGQPWELFTYGRSQTISQTTLAATAVHTNVPRPSYAGLPMGWQMAIVRWRATTNLRTNRHAEALHTIADDMIRDNRPIEAIETLRELSGALLEPQIVLDWAADCSIEFHRNGQPIACLPLLDLLHQPQYLTETPGRYVDSNGRSHGEGPEGPLQLLENINFEIRVNQQYHKNYERLRDWIATTPSRRMTLWIWLEGNLTRNGY